MRPDAIGKNNQTVKVDNPLSAPKATTIDAFSKLGKGKILSDINFKSVANTQSKEAMLGKKATGNNVINVDFNNSKHSPLTPADVPNDYNIKGQAETQNKKLKRGFFAKAWDNHGRHILGSLDAVPGTRTVKTGVLGLIALGSIRKISAPIFKKTSEATLVANKLGYQKINETIHDGQAVYKKGKSFITRDLDSHNGGAWKMADSIKNLGAKKTRDGTFNIDLTKRIGK